METQVKFADGTVRDVEITLARNCGDCVAVECMFDKDGSETFDPTVCVEIEGEDDMLHRLETDEIITMRVRI